MIIARGKENWKALARFSALAVCLGILPLITYLGTMLRILLSETAMRVLHSCDGARTAHEISAQLGGAEREMLRLIEELFVAGLLWLSDRSSDADSISRFEASGESVEHLVRSRG